MNWILKQKQGEVNQFQEVFNAIEANCKSSNTQKAYKNDLAQFHRFTNSETSTDHLKAFLFMLASKKYKWNSIQRKYAAITSRYTELVTPGIKNYLKGLQRTLLERDSSQVISKQAKPIRKDILIKICQELILDGSRKAQRDRLLILIGWVCALRVSELQNIRRCDLEKIPEGYFTTTK